MATESQISPAPGSPGADTAGAGRDPALEEVELELLLEGLSRQYGHDLRGYARGALKRRVLASVRAEGLRSISGLQELALHDASAMARLLAALTAGVGSLFRDPGFFVAFRRRIVPLLRTYPFVRIWHAGCATGEDVYSLAIVLHEEGLTSRVRTYATDVAEGALARAKAGVYAVERVPELEARYAKAGGRRSLADYTSFGREGMTLRPALRDNVVFGQHNLATDRSFNEFNVVLCRDVMIHFSRALQTTVLSLLHASLCRLGILGLGARESLRGSGFDARFDPLDDEARLFRRIG
ncbi:MAG: methyltransferase, CheR-type, SAM-binding domain, C-terminal [Myxococcales bacterium]|nr:methyltransferase, CheR-type, SAM-binding domain, C-terminal [Myxococcales bacterium]